MVQKGLYCAILAEEGWKWKPRKSNPSETLTTRVFISFRFNPILAKKDLIVGITYCSSISLDGASTIKSIKSIKERKEDYGSRTAKRR
ncbi:MAG: hypothetical protein ACTSU9_15000 [Promethearchaeota archaeon]